ncbi:hypothetical protein L580_1351 [Serratia fonticola AU-P3(3)]|nr:hypothetical protein L580_1351 [Serratia fonticola AU-P3(3)]
MPLHSGQLNAFYSLLAQCWSLIRWERLIVNLLMIVGAK